MEKKSKQILSVIIAVSIISISILSFPVASQIVWDPTWNNTNIKNVIVMVPDGCSQSIVTAARWYNGEPLNLDSIQTGVVSTYMADSIITDSASAATAFATGHKTSNGFISVGPRTDTLLTGARSPLTPIADAYEPLATVLEGAKLEGKATGLVATSRITHATPAAYAAHIESRNLENDIMEHMVYQDLDVVLGGGKRHLESSRTDGENLTQVLIDRGYQFVETKDEMDVLDSGKVWGMFASSHMEADIDRAEFAPEQPSLAEMTEKAIEILSQDEDGFFLMVEGSQVDWAGHANDPIYMITDFLAFDDAVGVTMEFAKQDKNTLVLVFPDHNTGALSIGSYYQDINAIGNGYTETTIEDLVDPIAEMKITSTGLARKLSELESPTNDDIKAIFNEWWGLEITDDDIAAMDLTDSYSISEYISKAYTIFGWTTHGHTGEDVPLWAYGPKDMVPIGCYDNTEMAIIIAEAFGFNLDVVAQRLFVNIDEEREIDEWTLDMTDAENPVLLITVDGNDAELPVSKNLISVFGQPDMELEGLVVYAPETGNVYIPEQAIYYLKYIV
jgi:alkaline phosphatase